MDYTIISDIHGDYEGFSPDSLASADALLIAGDITNLGNYRPKEVNKAKVWLDSLKPKYDKIFYIFGNHDLGLSSCDFDSSGVICVQDRVIRYGSLVIAGANLSVCYNMPSLKRVWTNMTDNHEVESAYYDTLLPCDILISHSPPSGKLAMSFDGQDCGSVRLREYIEVNQPKLVVCGHIHEAAGSEYIGKTLVVNTACRSYNLKGTENWDINKKVNP